MPQWNAPIICVVQSGLEIVWVSRWDRGSSVRPRSYRENGTFGTVMAIKVYDDPLVSNLTHSARKRLAPRTTIEIFSVDINVCRLFH